MVLLSRKRKIPRIVKKKKEKSGRKQLNIKMLDPRIREHWDATKSVHENFSNIGLKLDVNPSLKRSKEGKSTVQQAQKIFKRDDEEDEEEQEETPQVNEDSEEESEEEAPKKAAPKPDLAKLF